jgi:SAM-dependent methyltransferase
VQVADIGCGNGRFALMLESLARPIAYTGVDGNRSLLALAEKQTKDLSLVETRFLEADLSDAHWTDRIEAPDAYDLVVCLATMQHLPGYELRADVMADLASLLKPDGLLAVSAWQFLESERFRNRVVDWHEIGLNDDDVESCDALLPWKQGSFALRYVHQIDENELTSLAADAGMTIRETYRADGKEGNLNLYAILHVD